MNQEAPYIVSGSHLLPGWQQRDVMRNAAVLVSGHTIEAVGSRSTLLRSHPGAAEIHEPHGLIMPGLVNGCSWINQDRYTSPGKTPSGTSLSGNEVDSYSTASVSEQADLLHLQRLAIMLKSGTTSFCDLTSPSHSAARAAEKAGIRAWLAYPPADQQAVTSHAPLSDLTETESESARSPSSLLSYTDVFNLDTDPLLDCHDNALDTSRSIVILLPQSGPKLSEFITLRGITPVQYLDKTALLTTRCCIIAGTDLSDDDGDILRDKGVKLIYCQSSEQATILRTNVSHRASSAITVQGLGTGCFPAGSLDMFRLMNQVAKIAKVLTMDPTAMNAESTLWAATHGGAELLRATHDIGTIEVGKQADFIVIDLHQPHLTPLNNVVSHLVYAARGADVKHAIIGGRVVLRDRNLLTLDERVLLRELDAFQQSQTKGG